MLRNSDALNGLGFLISTNLIKIYPMGQHSVENSHVTLGSVKMTIKVSIILRMAKTETEIYCLALGNQSFGGIIINLKLFRAEYATDIFPLWLRLYVPRVEMAGCWDDCICSSDIYPT